MSFAEIRGDLRITSNNPQIRKNSKSQFFIGGPTFPDNTFPDNFQFIWGQFRVDLGQFGVRFGVDSGSIWDRFGVGLGSVWDQFGVDLGSVRGRFGVDLVSLGIILQICRNFVRKILSGKVSPYCTGSATAADT